MPPKKAPEASAVSDNQHQKLCTLVTERRLQLGYSLREVADKAEVSASTLHAFEQGNLRIQLDNFLKILAVLELAPADVFRTLGQTESVLPPTDLDRQISAILKTGSLPDVLIRIAELIRRNS